jgi:hypothetical protein
VLVALRHQDTVTIRPLDADSVIATVPLAALAGTALGTALSEARTGVGSIDLDQAAYDRLRWIAAPLAT